MKPLTCPEVRKTLDEHVRHELDRRTSTALAAHLAACAGCAGEAGRAQHALRALDAVRGEALLEGIDESRFRVLRARVMAQVGAQVDNAAPSAGFFGFRFAWGTAAAAAVIASFLALSSAPERPGSGPVALGPALEYQAVKVVTFATKDGVSLHWSGDATTYVVMKSSRPSLDGAETTVVCGTDWTDRNPALGATFYRVVPAHEPCRT